jgi:hypothetical protein
MHKGLPIAVLSLLLSTARVLAGEADPFGEFISPVANPVNFEDARATTEVRPLYVYHRISDDFGKEVGLNGGDAHVVAVQLRVAVTERLALIATKDGYVWLRPDDELDQIVEKRNGLANLAFGLKYAFYRDPERRAMGTFGLRYEAPVGDKDVKQGKVFRLNALEERGDGVFNPFLTGLWGIGDFHLQAYTAGRIPIDGVDSTFFDMSLHGDYRIGSFFPLLELNWVQTVDGGDRAPIDQEGFDFFNLGSKDAGGHGVVAMALGARWRAAEHFELASGRSLAIDMGAAYELPLTDREDVFGWRVTSDVIVRLL